MDAVMERERRSKAIRAGRDGRHERLDGSCWAGQPAAIYCRISKADDDDQTSVDRQERLCREVADRLRLVVTSDAVFVDPNRSAWKRDRKRPGWDRLIDAMRDGRFRNVIVYHPDRLMRQPKDLEELLTISDEHGITLHGQANRRDLSDPDDRFFLRIEVAHACRSSDDTSRRIKDKLADRALDGLPHTPGRRRFGYTRDGMTVIEDEAAVIRDVYSSYLDGMSPRDIAAMLAERGFRTVYGNTAWAATTVRRLLSLPYLTGILVFRGEMIGEGTWPAIVDRGVWNEVQERRTVRGARFGVQETREPILPAARPRDVHKVWYAHVGFWNCGRAREKGADVRVHSQRYFQQRGSVFSRDRCGTPGEIRGRRRDSVADNFGSFRQPGSRCRPDKAGTRSDRGGRARIG